MSKTDVIVKTGSKPVLALTIHWNRCRSLKNPRPYREGGTKAVNERLYSECGYYSFIYTGMKSGLMGRINSPLSNLIEEMLGKFGRIGVLSIHRRDNKRLDAVPSDFFDLGSLAGLAMDPRIASVLADILLWHGKTFSNNAHFVGGTEIQFLHKTYNDPGYNHVTIRGTRRQRGLLIERLLEENASYAPSSNRLHIAQMEFAAKFMNNRNRNDWPFFACKTLGDFVMAYLA